MAANRKGDKVAIAGAYQYNAVHRGNTFQRSWHQLKLKAAAMLAHVQPADRLLDLGCGSGILLSFLPAFDTYTGLDANPDAIAFGRQTYSLPGVSFQLLQIDDLQQVAAASFSRIFFLETIEHITEAQGRHTLQQFYRLLEPGGTCIISTPNRKSLWPAIEWLLDFLRLTPRLKDEQHEKLYSVPELKTLALQSRLQVKEVRTMNGIAPWLSFLEARTTLAIHHWEMRQAWLPGSLILLVLQKPAKAG